MLRISREKLSYRAVQPYIIIGFAPIIMDIAMLRNKKKMSLCILAKNGAFLLMYYTSVLLNLWIEYIWRINL